MGVIPVMRPWLGEAEERAVQEVVRSGWVAQGPKVAEFEERFATHVGAAHGVAVSSCTAGLHLSLLALDIGPGDDVVVPSLSFIATANAVRQAGANPVFADVDERTQNVTVDTVKAVMTPQTRAVFVVHQVGMPAAIDELAALCSDAGVEMVEDAACAAGSTYRGAPIGGHSRLVAFSFHPRKILTTGEGGMVTTSDAALAERLTRLRQHGMSVGAFERHATSGPVREAYVESGWNYRMTDIQAAVGLVQLDKLDEMVARRRAQADVYRDALGSIETIRLPADPPYGTTNYQSYVVVVGADHPRSVAELLEAYEERGISPRRGIMAAHLEPAYDGHPHAPLPVTEHLTANSLILPMFHEMTEREQRQVIDVLANR